MAKEKCEVEKVRKERKNHGSVVEEKYVRLRII